MSLSSLLNFLNRSPTSFHAAANLVEAFLEKGFTKLNEGEAWTLERGKGYLIQREGSLIALRVPEGEMKGILALGAHTDSPGLKLKPKPEVVRENMLLLSSEVYGAPLLSSWLNRDLSLAGKVVFVDRNDKVHEALVWIERPLAIIPQLAIHLDRNVNEQGLILNKQEHLLALVGLKETSFESILQEKLPLKSLVSHDLFLIPFEEARAVGEFIASARLDNLASCHAILEAFPTPSEEIQAALFFDHEEIGSESERGASSPFFEQAMERVFYGLGKTREDYLRTLSEGLAVSVDLAHAAHPNYLDRHEAGHRLYFGQGVVVKWNAQLKYATSSRSFKRLAETGQSLQHFVTKSDIPCGSTIGPLIASRTGMQTCDIGIPQLSMHSIRELIHKEDYLSLVKLLKSL